MERTTIKKFRDKYPKFIYKNFSYRISGKNLEIFFLFEIKPNIFFKQKVIIENVQKSQMGKVGKRILENLIFHLGLIEMLSYWKATCSPEIIIEAGTLNSEQILWWKDLILKGMGQFFYENKIDYRKPNFLKITSKGNNATSNNLTKQDFVKLKEKVLVPVGGGKDSVVTLETLSSFVKASKEKEKIRCFSLNPTEATMKIIKIAGCLDPIIVKREIDPKLLELNRQGFLNGHTPFSAYLAFLSVLVAKIFDYKYIALSNERSSNEGNLKYLGRVVNHQYSKSFEFEKKFQNYYKKYLTKDI